MQRVRAIGTSGRKSPSRPPSPRFSDIPNGPIPPLPSRDPRASPALRSISPRSTTVPPQLPFLSPLITGDRSQSPLHPAIDTQGTSNILVSPVPRREPYSHIIQQDLVRPGCRSTPLRRISTTPDIKFQPHDLTGQITSDKYVFAGGSYGDVWKGSLRDGTMVAIKVLRPPSEADRQKTNRKLRREIDVWKRLVHENVVPLLGIATDVGSYTSMGMVSLWMENGDLNAFLQRPTTLPLSSRIGLLCDVAAGLAYLHLKFVIHGDLTGANILIDGDGRARLVDFGLSTIKAEFEGTSYYSSTVGGALRWRAPELLSLSDDDVSSTLSPACDIYSYGSITLQVLSGKIPYHDIKSEIQVLSALIQGARPKRPSEAWITDALWEFIQHCWDVDQDARPDIKEVNDRMTGFRRICINQDRCLTIPSTDGYETDSEAFHSSGQTSKFSSWQSDHESYTNPRKSAKKSRFSRHKTLSLLRTMHLRRTTASPTVRTIYLLNHAPQHYRESISSEISALKTAVHPNICNIIDLEDSDINVIRLTLEPIIGMALSDILQRSLPTKEQMSRLLSMIVDGLRHLHDLNIVHGDLNSGNIVLDEQGCVKLIDFGLSAKAQREQSNHVGPIERPYWTAPEFIANGKYSLAMDIWSLGIVSIEMVEKQPPYFDKDPHIARELIAGGGTPRLKSPQTIPWELIEFLSLCLVGNAPERATASELCVHEFLANTCSTMTLVLLLDLELLRSF